LSLFQNQVEWQPNVHVNRRQQHHAATISIAQIGWVVQIVVPLAASNAIMLGSILVLIEMTGPVLAERQAGGTPWHAHHIAERHSLFAYARAGGHRCGV
jgi:low temperature requirement protein LtrA